MKRFSVILLSMLFATTACAEAPATQGSGLSSILMLVAFFAVVYFLLMRPQMKRNKEQRKMLSEKVSVAFTRYPNLENLFSQILKNTDMSVSGLHNYV